MQLVDASPWPEGCCGAVSLTFDDGRASQLAHAIPILEEHGLTGTFYLNPRGATEAEWRERLRPWVAVQAKGHEIGNHSLSHLCSQAHRPHRSAVPRALETATLEEVQADVLQAERRLDAGLPAPAGQRRTFGYPCYHEHVGEGPTRQSYVPIIARHFLAGRGRGEFGDNYPETCDLHYLWSWNVELQHGAMLVGLAERAALGRWVILTFHGIGDSELTNTAGSLRELAAFLARSRPRLWTAPLGTVAQRIAAWRESATA